MIRAAVVFLLVMSAQAVAQQAATPEIPYESMPNVLKLPADLYLGEVPGVAVNSKGHIFVYTRSGHTRLLEFDADGKFTREIGKHLYGFDFAHVVRVDRDDNIWCVQHGHQVQSRGPGADGSWQKMGIGRGQARAAQTG